MYTVQFRQVFTLYKNSQHWGIIVNKNFKIFCDGGKYKQNTGYQPNMESNDLMKNVFN